MSTMFMFCLRNVKASPIGLLSSHSWQAKGIPTVVRIPYQQWPTPLNALPDARLHTSAKASSSHAEHSHVKVWTAERIISAGLAGLVPVAFMASSPFLDYLLALALTTHIHWGVEAIAVDYVRPSIFGPTIPKIAIGAVYGLSILALGSLFYFNYTDVGLIQAIKMLWKL